MLRRPFPALLVLAALALALIGCSEVQETAGRAGDCAGLVQDVAASGLAQTPTLEEAEAAVRRLDERVASIDDPELEAAAGTLRDRLREVAEAARAADAAAAQAAAAEARDAARETADLCGVPVDQLLGG